MKETTPLKEAEINNVGTTTISGIELIERIYEGVPLPEDKRFFSLYSYGPLPQDERFLHPHRGGAFEYFDLEGLIRNPNSIYFSVLESDGKIIGLSKLKKNPKDERNIWLMFMSIDPKYQGKGYSHKLIDEVIKFSEEHADSLTLSHYSPKGKERVKRYIDKIREGRHIKVIGPNWTNL